MAPIIIQSGDLGDLEDLLSKQSPTAYKASDLETTTYLNEQVVTVSHNRQTDRLTTTRSDLLKLGLRIPLLGSPNTELLVNYVAEFAHPGGFLDKGRELLQKEAATLGWIIPPLDKTKKSTVNFHIKNNEIIVTETFSLPAAQDIKNKTGESLGSGNSSIATATITSCISSAEGKIKHELTSFAFDDHDKQACAKLQGNDVEDKKSIDDKTFLKCEAFNVIVNLSKALPPNDPLAVDLRSQLIHASKQIFKATDNQGSKIDLNKITSDDIMCTELDFANLLAALVSTIEKNGEHLQKILTVKNTDKVEPVFSALLNLKTILKNKPFPQASEQNIHTILKNADQTIKVLSANIVSNKKPSILAALNPLSLLRKVATGINAACLACARLFTKKSRLKK